MQRIFWMMAIASWLHIFEEYAYPGGFLRWLRQCVPRAKLTVVDAVIINALFLAFVASPLFVDFRGAPIVAVSIPAILAINACVHVGGTIYSKRYSPGLVTAVVLYWPVGAYAIFMMARTWALPAPTIAEGIALGFGWHSIPFIRGFILS